MFINQLFFAILTKNKWYPSSNALFTVENSLLAATEKEARVQIKLGKQETNLLSVPLSGHAKLGQRANAWTH